MQDKQQDYDNAIRDCLAQFNSRTKHNVEDTDADAEARRQREAAAAAAAAEAADKKSKELPDDTTPDPDPTAGGALPCDPQTEATLAEKKRLADNAAKRTEEVYNQMQKNLVQNYQEHSNDPAVRAELEKAQKAAQDARNASNELSRINCGEPGAITRADALLGQAQQSEITANATKPDMDTAISTGIAKQERAVSKRYREELKSCEKARKVADECCSNPESCLTKPDGEYSPNDGMAGGIIKMIMMTAQQVPSGSVSSMCGKMKTLSNASTVLNGYLAAQCGRYVSQCKKACEPPQELLADMSKCDSEDLTSKKCELVETEKNKFTDEIDECATMDNQSMRLAAQAVAGQMAAKFADMCKNQFADQQLPDEPVVPDDLFANSNCASPTAQTMAFCQAQCSRPGAQQDPNCRAFLGLNNVGQGYGRADTGGQGGLFDDLDADESGEQTPNFADIAPQANSSTGVGAGGGGGMLGGGDSGGGGGGEGGYGPGADGYNTKIDRGLASGSGYSSAGGRMTTGSGGGFSGYGGRAITNKDNGKPFNLKDFLPGKNQNAAVRGLASVAQDISPASDDIFKKVTSRFYQLCLRDALYDCATLKKLKPTGN